MALFDTLGRVKLSGSAKVSARTPTVCSNKPLPDNYVVTLLNAVDRTPRRTRRIEDGYIHVSSLIGFCPRQRVLVAGQDIAHAESVTGGHRIMWEIGRAVERHIRAQFISGDLSSVYGKWSCICGMTSRVGMYNDNIMCTRCNTKADTYHEVTLFDHDTRISGNPDLIFLYDNAKVVLEIKSMNKRDYDDLKAPLGDHVFQASFYNYLLRKNGHRVHRVVVIVYCTKDFKFGSPYKEFHVDTETQQVTFAISRSLDMARQVKDHAEAGTIPRNTMCSSPTSTKAKSCPVVARCFSAP